MHMKQEEVWLTPIGLMLDLHACHLQSIGAEKPVLEYTIDDVIPYGI